MSKSKVSFALVCAIFSALSLQSYQSVLVGQNSINQKRVSASFSDGHLNQDSTRRRTSSVATVSFSDQTPRVSSRNSSRRPLPSGSVIASQISSTPNFASPVPKNNPRSGAKFNKPAIIIPPVAHEKISVQSKSNPPVAPNTQVGSHLTSSRIRNRPRISIPPIVSGNSSTPQQSVSQNAVHQRPTDYRFASKPQTPHFTPVQTKLNSPVLGPQQQDRLGAMTIPPRVDNFNFVDAKQFLSQARQLDDPKKYLDPPKKTRKPAPRLAKKRQTQPRKPTATRARQQQDTTPVQRPVDGSILDSVADVRLPISLVPLGNIHQVDRSNLLTNDRHYQPTGFADTYNYSQLTNNAFVPSSKAWLASNFVHRPLYFEETQLERYGNRTKLQLLRSGIHFFGTLPVLPYKMGADLPNMCKYTYGHYRPGDCVPYDVYRRPLNKTGLISQAFWTTALVLP